jgi:hypothetical protein
MKKPGKKELLQAVSFVLCSAMAWTQADRVDGSEFIVGRVTGPIFTLFESGLLIFVLATVVTFIYRLYIGHISYISAIYRRAAAVMGIAACLLCFPLYLYFTAPGPFRFVFRGTYSVPLQSNFVWDKEMVGGMLTLVVAVLVSLRNFPAARRQRDADAHNAL